MKPKPRSKSSRCLFCFRNCSNEVDLILEAEMAGAVHCLSLKKQLQMMFILRNLLDIERSWCENKLKSYAEEKMMSNIDEHGIDPQNSGGNLGSWFKLCKQCVSKVADAWRIYQKILAHQSNMNQIKRDIREVMKGGIQKSKTLANNGSIEQEIRTLVFPELAVEQETQEYFDESSQFMDISGNDSESSFSEDETEEEPRRRAKLGKCGLKKKRGRPPKNPNAVKAIGKSGLPKIKRKLFFCPRCSFRFRADETERINLHMDLHKKSDEMGGGEFDCTQCSYPAQDCLELDNHVKTRHINSMRTFSCPKCDFTSRYWKLLREHADENHAAMTDEELGMEKNFKCPSCFKVLANLRAFQNHKRALHPELLGIEQEEVSCPECDQKFTSRMALQSHIKNIHEDNKRFMCDICGRGFSFLSRLEKHKYTHMTNRDFVCKICNVDYVREFCFTKHMKKVHPNITGEEQTASIASYEQLSCRYCSFTTPFRPALVKHLQIHKADMGNKCDKCGKLYTSAQGLQRHLRINHSDQQVPCLYCNKIFSSLEYMKDHMRRFCRMREMKERSSSSTFKNKSNTSSGRSKDDSASFNSEEAPIAIIDCVSNFAASEIEISQVDPYENKGSQTSSTSFAKSWEQTVIEAKIE